MITFSNPVKILEQISISPGSVVVDLGSGSGHYSIECARRVDSEGSVYAVDVQKDLLDRLLDMANNEGHSNVEVIWGDIEKYGGTRLRDGTADLVLLSNILFQLEDKRTAIMEAKRLMRPNGRLLVVDWSDSYFGMGPDKEKIVTEHLATELLQEQGLQIDSRLQAGDHHWGLVLRVNAN